MSLPVLATYVCRGWDSNTEPSACKANALTNCATPGGCHNRCGTKKTLLLNRKNKHEQLNNLYLYFHSHKYVESWFDNTVGMQMFKNVILRLWISLHAIGCKYENSPSKIQVIHVVHGIWIIFQGGGGLVLKHVWFKNPHTNLNSYQS